MKTKLTDLTQVVRSKNSGPYELTFDLIFKTREDYNKVAESAQINAEMFAKLYKIDIDDVLSVINFSPANAIKVTIKRPFASGNLGETDVYGAQQHAPLLNVVLDI